MKQLSLWPFPVIRPKENNTERNYDQVLPLDSDLTTAKKYGISIVHIPIPNSHKGGLTVAFSKSNSYKSGIMVKCAVQTCSINDFFSKKIGRKGAVNKFINNEIIELPLLLIYPAENINNVVKRVFSSIFSYTTSYNDYVTM